MHRLGTAKGAKIAKDYFHVIPAKAGIHLAARAE
jgi:hypothetical protein